jgi:hypothetical protein
MPSAPRPQTAKEVVAANVKLLIEQLEAGHTEALTAMARFRNYSLSNCLEIARQFPSATRVAGMYAWNQLGRRVKKGSKGIRILAPVIGVRRKKDAEAEQDVTKQNEAVVIGFRSAYVFDVSMTTGPNLPELFRCTATTCCTAACSCTETWRCIALTCCTANLRYTADTFMLYII